MTTTSPTPEPPARRHRAAEQAARRRAARRDARRARRAHREARRAQHHVNQAREALQPREDLGPLTRWEPTPGDRLPDAERAARRRATVLAVLFLLWASFNVAALLYMVNSDHTHTHPRRHHATTTTASPAAAARAVSAAVQPVAFHTTIPAATRPAIQVAARPGRVVGAIKSGDDRPRCERTGGDRGPIVVRTGPLDISIGGNDNDSDDDGGPSCDRTRVHRTGERDKDKDKDKDKDRTRDSGDRCVCVIPGHRADDDDDRDGWGGRDRTGWGRPWDRDTRTWPSYPAGYDRSDYPRDGRPGDEVCRSYPARVHPDVPDGGTVCSSPDRPSRRW